MNWLNPADQTVLETSIAYEQVAVDLTAYLARHEPDPYMRESLHFGLLEDFDHLYRYSELMDYLEGTDANTILQSKTDIMPGRPTEHHHNDPEARLLKHYEKNRAHPISKLHIWTLLSGEQQTRNYYKSHGFMYADRTARELYAEIGEVEEEHVSFYESLTDPAGTPLERMVLHELMEVYNYLHCLEQEASSLLDSALLVDGMSPEEIEANDLENVLLAETKDQADWVLLTQLAEGLDDDVAPGVKEALSEAVRRSGAGRAQEDEHLGWARTRLAEMRMSAMLAGPAPPPERWQSRLSGPIPPISEVHPAPIKEGLLEGAAEPAWIPSVISRSMGVQAP